jgi:lactam utilization protein B
MTRDDFDAYAGEDGKLSITEYRAACKDKKFTNIVFNSNDTMRIGNAQGVNVHETFDDLNKEKDGKLGLKEIEKFVRRNQKRAAKQIKKLPHANTVY